MPTRAVTKMLMMMLNGLERKAPILANSDARMVVAAPTLTVPSSWPSRETVTVPSSCVAEMGAVSSSFQVGVIVRSDVLVSMGTVALKASSATSPTSSPSLD